MNRIYCISIIVFCFCYLQGKANIRDIREGNWKIVYHAGTGTMDYLYGNKPVLSGISSVVRLQDKDLDTRKSLSVKMKKQDVSGKGKKYTFDYRFPDGIRLEQVLYFYPGQDYFLTEVIVRSPSEVSSRYMAPVVAATPVSLPVPGNNKIVFVPFDNDAWVRYGSLDMDTTVTSYEVTAIFNGESRNGLVIGSVEHDTWKTGITVKATNGKSIDNLECFAGVTSGLTRDVLPHGLVSGKELKSPKILVGFFDDWRDGLDQYARANAAIAPPRTWANGTPFGWNSWGAMQVKVNYEGAVDVSDFIKQELQPRGFENNGTTYIDLDSFWDNFTDEQLKQFADHCIANGQVPGIYWSPFADWGKYPDGGMNGSEYRYKDAYLYANGKEQELDGAYAIDPTHPGTKKRIDYFADRFLKAGFRYVKLDFMGHGALEADSHYDKSVTTGIQAYNAGLKYLVEKLGTEMYIALSIAPAFPSQYGHSRRISCDAWGNIGSPEYMLNSLSFGWWLDKVYTFNDADHLVLYDFSEGENRARITSGVITGIYMLGDNFSRKGSFTGEMKAREQALKFAANPDINDIARTGRSFKPVEGYRASSETGAEPVFTYETTDHVYWVAFNYSESDRTEKIDLQRIGLNPEKEYTAKELWQQNQLRITDQTDVTVPAKDVRLYRINKK